MKWCPKKIAMELSKFFISDSRFQKKSRPNWASWREIVFIISGLFLITSFGILGRLTISLKDT
jgi:hypothetical protein